MSVTILSVVGARPQFVKAAAVSRVIRETRVLAETLVHTGQHFDGNMSDVFFDELGISPPAHSLGIAGGKHGDMTGRMLAALERLMLQHRPHWVLVYGDTNSTLAGALAAAKLHIPVAHVEAGLRSFNRQMPEEINRVLTDHVSSLLFCPTKAAVRNLEAEGIRDGVHHVGDVMFDATRDAITASADRTILTDLSLTPGTFAVATVHRAENTDDPARLSEILTFLQEQAAAGPIVFSVHPRTRAVIERHGLSLEGLHACPPLGYLDMAKLLSACRVVFTDSGGLQKEAYFHRKPCVTLRDETEWVETIECGWNRLWKTSDYLARKEIREYGSGAAAREVVTHLTAAIRGPVGTTRPC
jgi:UDP-GlcNAc3NAcA epimerase